MLKIGDYVNGQKVEDVEVIGQELHVLVTYFCPVLRKPQSKWLPKSEITSVVKKEDFDAIRRTV